MENTVPKPTFSLENGLGIDIPRPSRRLGRDGSAFFRAVFEGFDVAEWERPLVELAALQLDRQRQAARRIKASASERSRERLLAGERAACAMFAKLLKTLDLKASEKTKPDWKRY